MSFKLYSWKYGGKGEYVYRIQAEMTDRRHLPKIESYFKQEKFRLIGEMFGKKESELMLIYQRNFETLENWLSWLKDVPFDIYELTKNGNKTRKISSSSNKSQKKVERTSNKQTTVEQKESKSPRLKHYKNKALQQCHQNNFGLLQCETHTQAHAWPQPKRHG